MCKITEVQQYLLSHNVKPSLQRLAVMDYLMKQKNHPTVDEIFHALKVSMPTLSKTTIYNTVKLLVEHHAVLSLNIDETMARYDGDTSNHAHLICTECKKVYDLQLLSNPQVCSNMHHRIFSLTVNAVGVCEECLRKSEEIK